MKHIVILGGGFAGLYTALELQRLPDGESRRVTLVDRQERFLFSPLLYEYLIGEMDAWEIAPYLRELVGPPHQVVRDLVTGVDLSQRQVYLAAQPPLTYDALVLALGGETPSFGIPGVAEYAYGFRTLADAERLRERLTSLPSSAVITIVGAGASGVELACKLADRLGSQTQIRLLDRGSQILSGFAAATVQAAETALQQRQVTLMLNRQVVAIGRDFVQWHPLPSGDIHQDKTDVVIWVTGTAAHPLIQSLPVLKTARQSVQVTPTLQVPDYPEVFAVGDLSATSDVSGHPIPASAQAAFQQAGYCAWNLWAYLSPHALRPLLPFRYQPLGEMLSLGTDTAVLSGLGLTLTGSLGYLARRAIYLGRLPTWEHQRKVGWQWLSRPFSQFLNIS
ncbi:MAG: NAD(P)/FAD-dependent oxidoreductase [Synechococcales cyanobacterium]